MVRRDHLAAPLYFGTANADASGVAAIMVQVPAFVAGMPLLLQAYDQAGCATSNVVAFTFQ